jgi:hypothetical protein
LNSVRSGLVLLLALLLGQQVVLFLGLLHVDVLEELVDELLVLEDFFLVLLIFLVFLGYFLGLLHEFLLRKFVLLGEEQFPLALLALLVLKQGEADGLGHLGVHRGVDGLHVFLLHLR